VTSGQEILKEEKKGRSIHQRKRGKQESFQDNNVLTYLGESDFM